VLEPECAGETKHKWGILLRAIISTELRRGGLTVCPETSMNWAVRAANDSTNSSPQERARRIGEILGAGHVILGQYRQDRGEWELSLRILTTASGQMSPERHQRSTNWTEVLPSVCANLVTELGGSTNTVGSVLDFPESVLELVCDMFALSRTHGSIEGLKAKAEKAVEAAPQSAFLRRALAQTLVAAGDLVAAGAEAKKAVSLDSRYAGGPSILGDVYLLNGMAHLARAVRESRIS